MQLATEIYSCKPTARIVAPLLGDVTANRFLFATASAGDDNEVGMSTEHDKVDSPR